MNHINVSVTVERSSIETMTRLDSFLHEFAPQAEMKITLRAPFDITALNVGVTLARDVVARFAPLGSDQRAYAVAWHPAIAGPFPEFAGTIFVSTSEANSEESIIALDGHYHPPLGVAGDVFDAILGRHIAQACATDLLERITMYVDNIVVPESAFA